VAGKDGWCCVVIPCLNEADYILSTCRSLGFAAGLRPPRDCSLILVDNGSTDQTPLVCAALHREVGPQVVYVREPTRGHIPARSRGVDAARVLAARAKIPLTKALVIQADADTEYSAGYVDALRDAAHSQSGRGAAIMQATTKLDSMTRNEYSAAFDLLNLIDVEIERSYPMHRLDCIVDDKACAYFIADYDRWGGHRREYFPDGSEILAETSRLMISALACGAHRVDVADAVAVHSTRRLFEDAFHAFATDGFPYTASKPPWGGTGDAVPLNIMASAMSRKSFRRAAELRSLRIAHGVALFAVLPRHLATALGHHSSEAGPLGSALALLPRRSRKDALARPGDFLTDVLALAWQEATMLADCLGM
jgi:hypothetical protein